MDAMNRYLAVLAALLLGAAGFAFAQDATRTLSAGETRFLQKAAADGLAEVELGTLAQEKAMRDEVRQFAARMVADHRKANESLMEIAGAKRVQLPTQPDARHRRHAERLRKLSGPDFDRAYMKLMLDDHKDAVKDFERQTRSARDSDVRDFASRTLLTLRDHLGAARGTYDATLGTKRTGDRETGSKKP